MPEVIESRDIIVYFSRVREDMFLPFYLNMADLAQQAAFPPDVLARIAPDVSLQRHLLLGIRPCLRGFDEFRPLMATAGTLNSYGPNLVMGLSTVKNGDTHILCEITLGITELNSPDELLGSSSESTMYSSVYPVVEVARGRSGAPSDEEMILSQKLYNHVLHLHVLPLVSLRMVPGYQIIDESNGSTSIVYPDDSNMDKSDLESLSSTINITKKRFKFVLYAHIKVFSRSGPLFDAAHFSLMQALQDVKLPRIYMADSGIDPNIKVPVRSRGNFGHLNQSSGLFNIDSNWAIARPLRLALEEVGISSTFGLIDIEEVTNKSVLLADLEGEAEEFCAESKITVVGTGSKLKQVSLIGGGANFTLETIKKALEISSSRVSALKK